MSNVLIDRLTSVFGAPERIDDLAAFVSELKRITAGFSPDALDQAASMLIAHGGNSWPPPKAIVQACVDAQETLAIRHGRPQPKNKYPWDEAAEKGERWAREFCNSTEIGRRAFSEGWGKSLYLWANSYAQHSYNRDTPPNPSQRPQPFEIEYWVRYCRAPASWIESERVTYLRELFSAETNTRLNKKIAAVRAGKTGWGSALKQMPLEDGAADPGVPTIRPDAPRATPPAADKLTWAKRFGTRAAGMHEEDAA
jgi:hypothetical protein